MEQESNAGEDPDKGCAFFHAIQEPAFFLMADARVSFADGIPVILQGEDMRLEAAVDGIIRPADGK